jgi:hypothetical protein
MAGVDGMYMDNLDEWIHEENKVCTKCIMTDGRIVGLKSQYRFLNIIIDGKNYVPKEYSVG